MKQTRGQAVTWVLIVLAVLLVGGGAYLAYKKPIPMPLINTQAPTSTSNQNANSVEIRANGSLGQITVYPDQKLTISWTLPPQATDCRLSGTGLNGAIGGVGYNVVTKNDQWILGPGTESVLMPGDNTFTVACSSGGNSTVKVTVADRYASSNLKTYSNNLFSFQYPSNFNVMQNADGSLDVNGSSCLHTLQISSRSATPQTVDYWMQNLQTSNPVGYHFEGCSAEAKTGIAIWCSFTNNLGSSDRRTAIWFHNNYRVDMAYVTSEVNYSNVTGQKIDPNQGTSLVNNCANAFDAIMNNRGPYSQFKFN